MLTYDKKPKVDDFIKKYGDKYPLLKLFKDTEQDLVWHAEGHVHIHTDMVLDEIYKIIDDSKWCLSDSQKKVLMMAAVFHDYAKPITTKSVERHGRICVVASRHEFMGASLLFNLPRPQEITQSEWLSVIKLVAYHQMPKKAVRESYNFGGYMRLLNAAGDLKLLYLLELADMLGRTCEDMEENLLYLDLFKQDCESHGLFGLDGDLIQKEVRFNHSNLTDAVYHKGLYDISEGNIPNLECTSVMPYTNRPTPNLVILCGLPASGKSTLAKRLFSDYVVISLDSIRKELTGREEDQSQNDEVLRVAKSRLIECFRIGQNVVYDSTAFRFDFRSWVVDLARKYDVEYSYFIRILCVMSDIDKSVSQDTTRTRSVGRERIKDMAEKFQIPTYLESDRVEFIVQDIG